MHCRDGRMKLIVLMVDANLKVEEEGREERG
jgi:hypothetical protein